MTPPAQRAGLARRHASQFKGWSCCGFFESSGILVPSVGFMLQIAMAFLKVRRLLWFLGLSFIPAELSVSKQRLFWAAAREDSPVLWLGQGKENESLAALRETLRTNSACSKVFRRIKDSFPRIHSRVWNNNCSNIKIFLRLLICTDKSLPRNFVLIYTHASCTWDWYFG